CVCVSFMRFHSLRLRLFLFFPKSRRPPQSTPFPYTTLFRSHILTRRPVERAAFFETSYGSYDTRNFDLLLTEAKGPLRLSLDGNYFDTGGYPIVKESRRGAIDIDATSRHSTFNGRVELVDSPDLSLFASGNYFDEDR